MPSHTFTRLGLWEESVRANRASADAALRDGSVAEALHASDYLEYAYLQLGRDSAAGAVLDGLPALAARFDPDAVTGAAPGSAGVFALAAIPARHALERGDWREAASLPVSSTAVAYADALTHFARALGAARLGRVEVARAAVDSLDAMRARLLAGGDGYWADQVAIQTLGARAWLALAEGRRDEALARMREAAAREDATEKSAVTPGPAWCRACCSSSWPASTPRIPVPRSPGCSRSPQSGRSSGTRFRTASGAGADDGSRARASRTRCAWAKCS
jgi:hypothetical protein